MGALGNDIEVAIVIKIIHVVFIDVGDASRVFNGSDSFLILRRQINDFDKNVVTWIIQKANLAFRVFYICKVLKNLSFFFSYVRFANSFPLFMARNCCPMASKETSGVTRSLTCSSKSIDPVFTIVVGLNFWIL